MNRIPKPLRAFPVSPAAADGVSLGICFALLVCLSGLAEDRAGAAGVGKGTSRYSSAIQRHGDQWILFYTETSHTHEIPSPEQAVSSGSQDLPAAREAHANQRIGLATAPSITGPWTFREEPILSPRPGHWDSYLVCNPAPCILEDGSCLLIYKSIGFIGDTMRLGVARADHWEGPYQRVTDEPIFEFRADQPVEDPFLWWNGERFGILLRDWLGNITGEVKAGVHGVSDDGVHWTLSENPKAWSKTIRWDDGTRTTMHDVEVPKLTFDENSVATHLVLTVREGGTRTQPDRVRIVVIPLAE